ncbi:MAG: hypothetical protein JSW31_04150, partial [Burkholderiales bacterium]
MLERRHGAVMRVKAGLPTSAIAATKDAPQTRERSHRVGIVLDARQLCATRARENCLRWPVFMFASPRRADAGCVFAIVLMLKSLLVAAIAALLSFTVHAQTTEAGKSLVERDLGGDHFAAGCPVRIDKPVQGDVFLAGCSIDVDGTVDGDALVAGGTVRLNAPIGQSLYAAGGQLTVNANVARNARIAGGQVALESRAQVAGNVLIAGGDVRIDGAVKGYVRAAGGRVRINGPVGGDVIATAGAVELGPNARIAGQLRYASSEEIKRDAAAQVQGGVQRMHLEGG